MRKYIARARGSGLRTAQAASGGDRSLHSLSSRTRHAISRAHRQPAFPRTEGPRLWRRLHGRYRLPARRPSCRGGARIRGSH
ncbi:hypothetical protein [Mesorhizobium sp. B283B1A]|uniref:hypothetical protein n=1 Tax=Mesorhizobium sp. B283B1A TaxID=2876665 RepID=UPI00398CD138